MTDSNSWTPQPPQLCPISQCDKSLAFHPRSKWPEGLPAVAINGLVIAGFEQQLVFNHHIPEENSEAIANLFRSLYFELSLPEMARINQTAKAHSWFPRLEVLRKFGLQTELPIEEVFALVLQFPVGFQNWCAERKVTVTDLLFLLKVKDLDLKPLFLKILNSSMTREQGLQVLTAGIALLKAGKSSEDLVRSLEDEPLSPDWLLRQMEKDFQKPKFTH